MSIQYWYHNSIVIVCVLQVLKICCCHSQLKNIKSQPLNHNGDNYGLTWIYFPDGDDIPHYVNLTIPEHEIVLYPRILLDFAIEYRLYTRNNREDYIILSESEPSITEPNLKKILENIPLKIVTHGWRSSADKNAVINIKNAYLATQDVNVIAVDWSAIADNVFYPQVAYQTPVVGRRVGKFLDFLNERFCIKGHHIHLIGHSLGAHIMGIAAAHTDQTIQRITGLDPAHPLFEYRHKSEKLDSSDAQFVDVIHTCGGILGVQKAIGKADFFPNGGTPPQPGCESIQNIFETCSHGRSHLYYTESITNPKAFPAYKCNSWSDYLNKKCKQNGYMGDGANSKLDGEFYLNTNSKPPYGRSLSSESSETTKI